MLEILFAEFITHIIDGDEFFTVRFELVDDFFHAFDSRLMLVVVAEHFEDDFHE